MRGSGGGRGWVIGCVGVAGVKRGWWGVWWRGWDAMFCLGDMRANSFSLMKFESAIASLVPTAGSLM